MAVLFRPLGVLVGALVTVLTGATLSFAHVAPSHTEHRSPAAARVADASTSDEQVAANLLPRLVPTPTPTPAPTPTPIATPPAAEPAAAGPVAAPAPALPVSAPAPAAPVQAPAAAPAPAPFVVGSAQQSLINQDRAAAGLPPLNWSGCLASIAAGQSQAMAARGQIYHGNGVNQDFGCGLGSRQTGENVGYWTGGVNDSQLNTMFMNSAEHRANIMGPYQYVGTAWVTAANGTAYISVEFG